MIGALRMETPLSSSDAISASSGVSVDRPSVPRRSTTLAAPPPVVVTTATRGWRARRGGVRPESSGTISTSVSSMSTRTMPLCLK